MNFGKKDYNAKLTDSHKYDTKETWKVLNGSINSNYKTSTAYPDEEVHGKDILDGFNKFVTNVGPAFAATIPAHDNSVYDYLDEVNTHSMFLADTTEGEVLDIGRNLSNKTSGDRNDLSMSLVKFIIFSVKPFTIICHKSFSTGVFPDCMKIAQVIQYLYLSLAKKVCSVIIDQFLCYHNFLKYLKGFLITDK